MTVFVVLVAFVLGLTFGNPFARTWLTDLLDRVLGLFMRPYEAYSCVAEGADPWYAAELAEGFYEVYYDGRIEIRWLTAVQARFLIENDGLTVAPVVDCSHVEIGDSGAEEMSYHLSVINEEAPKFGFSARLKDSWVRYYEIVNARRLRREAASVLAEIRSNPNWVRENQIAVF